MQNISQNEKRNLNAQAHERSSRIQTGESDQWYDRRTCNKELKEICLVDQVYVKAEDGKQTVVAKYLDESFKAVGTPVSVKFVRFETGEGIENRKTLQLKLQHR